jgi:hypothetical protein
VNSDKVPVYAATSSAKTATLANEAEMEFFDDEPDNCDCGISSDPDEMIECFDDEPDLCECEIWDEDKERELHAEILRGLSADLDASQDPSRLLLPFRGR